MKKSLTDLLENCTVRIEVGEYSGTGFFVAPGTILTCAHVSKPRPGKNPPIKVIYKKRAYKPEKVSQKDIFADDYPDLALLRVNIPKHPCVFLDVDIQVRDEFYSFGYTSDQPKGEGATVDCEGTYDEDYHLIKLKMGQVQQGASGSPLLCSRTERVCGMIQMSRDPETDRGGFAFPIESINSFFPDMLEINKRFHDRNKQWEDACGQPIKHAGSTAPVLYVKPGTVVEPGKQLFGRQELLEQISAFLHEGKRVVLSGITGIGKTFLAENLAEKWLQEMPKPVAWLKVGFQDLESLLEALMSVLAEMGADRKQYDKALGDNKRLLILSMLEESSIGLLVFDDARNMDAMTLALRAIPKNIPVLITSRQTLDVDEIVDVDKEQLQPSDALALLGHYAGGENYAHDVEANQLCDNFGYHPLALELCGSIMRRQKRTPREQLLKLASDPLNLSKPGHVGLRALLEDSFNDLSQQSRLVFTGFGAFYENGITSVFLADYLGISVESLGTSLDDLFNYNLIKRQSGIEFYYMHDLIFAYSQTLAKLDNQASLKLIDATMRYLGKNAGNYEILSLDMHNLFSVADRCDPSKLIEIMSWLTIGGYPEPGPDSYIENKGYPPAFLDRLDKTIQACRRLDIYPRESLHYLLGKRGDSYFNMGDYENATSRYEEAILLAPNKKREALVMSVAAKTYGMWGDHQKSLKYFQDSYTIAEPLKDDLLLVSIMGQEILVASVVEDFEKIRDIARKQVEIMQRILSTNPSPLAYKHHFFALLNLGAAEMDLSKKGKSSFEIALPILQRASQVALAQKSDLLLAYVYDSLGEVFHYLHDSKSAKMYFERSMQLWIQLGMEKDAKELELRMQSLGYAINKKATISADIVKEERYENP